MPKALSRDERIKRDGEWANRYYFDHAFRKEMERRAVEAARKPNADYYCSGVSPLGGTAVVPKGQGRGR
jgi:hypothetical protein